MDIHGPKLITLLLLMLASSLHAKDKPDWIDTLPKDSTYKYYKGFGTSQKSENAAYNEAFSNALEQSIIENYGFHTNVQKESYSSSSEETSTKRIKELSQNVEIHDYEQVDSYSEEDDGKFSVWVLYRYRRSAIEHEKLRLSQLKDDEKEVKFQEAGSEVDSAKGVLEVITRPEAGASISIDSVPVTFLETPLRIFGKISVGKHRIIIEHSKYQPVTEDFVIVPGHTTKIEKTLKRATGKIRIVTTPANGNVIVGGKAQGVTPTDFIEVAAGDPIKIEISHSQCEPLSQTVTIEQDESRDINLNLTYKPSFIESIASKPTGAQIFVEDKNYGRTPLRKPIKVSPGSVIIKLVKDGFEDAVEKIEVEPAEHKTVGSIKLEKVDVAEKRRREEERRKEQEEDEEERRKEAEEAAKPNYSHLLSYSFGYQGSTVSIPSLYAIPNGLNYQYKIFRRLGISVGFSYSAMSSKYSNATLNLSEYVGTVGLPIFIARVSTSAERRLVFYNEWIIEPQWKYILNVYSLEGGSGSISRPQEAWGAVVRWRGIAIGKGRGPSWGLGSFIGLVAPYKSFGGIRGTTAFTIGAELLLGL